MGNKGVFQNSRRPKPERQKRFADLGGSGDPELRGQ
jgi:hypothetical protein